MPEGDLSALLEQEERNVKQARKAGDINALIGITTEVLARIDAVLADPALPGDVQTQALNITRRVGYNVAADIYPGWEVGSPSASPAQLAAAIEFAKQSKAAVERTGLGAMQQGNAIWLLAALDLAGGNHASAQTAFQQAEDIFAAADLPDMALMAAGYAAIAGHARNDFEATIAKLKEIGSEDAMETRDQLLVAIQIFPI